MLMLVLMPILVLVLVLLLWMLVLLLAMQDEDGGATEDAKDDADKFLSDGAVDKPYAPPLR